MIMAFVTPASAGDERSRFARLGGWLVYRRGSIIAAMAYVDTPDISAV
jgi:hypothetical protein